MYSRIMHTPVSVAYLTINSRHVSDRRHSMLAMLVEQGKGRHAAASLSRLTLQQWRMLYAELVDSESNTGSARFLLLLMSLPARHVLLHHPKPAYCRAGARTPQCP